MATVRPYHPVPASARSGDGPVSGDMYQNQAPSATAVRVKALELPLRIEHELDIGAVKGPLDRG